MIKIYPYHFELYRCKVGPFFLRHSVEFIYLLIMKIMHEAQRVFTFKNKLFNRWQSRNDI